MQHVNNILAELDFDALQTQGLAGPGDAPGFIRLHKRRLNSSSDGDYGDLPLAGLDDPTMAHAFSTVPTRLISRQTLLHFGLTTHRADQLWHAWENWPATGPQRETLPEEKDDVGAVSTVGTVGAVGVDVTGLDVAFVDFVLSRLLPVGVPDADGRHDDAAWMQCLDACGINRGLTEAIMDPRCRCIRQSNSCSFWMVDTVEMRYAGLQDTQRASQKRAYDISLRGGSGPSRGQAEAQPAENFKPSPQRRQQFFPLEARQTAGPGESSRHWSRQTAADVGSKPGHTVLYKGIDQGRLAGFWRQDDCNSRKDDDVNNNDVDNDVDNNVDNNDVDNDDDDDDDYGNWRVEKLLSFPPTSFSGRQALFYFYPDARVAEYYAAYAKRRAACESVVIVTLAIKNDDLAALEHPGDETEDGQVFRLYYPSPHWKQVVWRSKSARSFTEPLRKYRDALLLIGTTTKGALQAFTEMTSWEDITSENVLRVPDGNGRPAVQYVFNGEEGGRFLRRAGQFDVFPFPDTYADGILV